VILQIDGNAVSQARRYLEQRGLCDPALIKEPRIGYAPGGTLRRHLTAQGYSCELLRRLTQYLCANNKTGLREEESLCSSLATTSALTRR
jgi:hypothetical protein